MASLGSGWCVACAVVFGAAVTACSESSTTDPGAQPPAGVPGAEWEVAQPEEHRMDPASLDPARAYAFADGMNTQGVVVVHDGVIVAEWYGDGADEESWAAGQSVAKSFTSALVGIAIEDGLIPSVEEPMVTYFPEWAGSPRETITLRDVLQMSSGLDWVESNPAAPTEADSAQLVLGEGDQLTYASSPPADSEPGSVWNYSSGDTMLLSGVIEQATGMPADDYARQEIFDPLGMERVEWGRDTFVHTLTHCCIEATSREFARFGLLYERQGTWGDEQVVPGAWVAESLEPTPQSDNRYGYQWWLVQADTLPDDTFKAWGSDDQYIYVIPSLDLVIVRNGTYVKVSGPPIADPNMFTRYPFSGLAPGKGTLPPEQTWDDAEFLQPIVQSLTGT
jgi:CubicO group peptidase (beta-lactamase class C family)